MNILIDSIRSDGEYVELLKTLKGNFHKKPLPSVAGGLCEGAQDAMCLALCDDTRDDRSLPMLVICSDEKECLRQSQMFERFGKKSAFYIARDLTFHNITASHEYEHERLRVLSGLIDGAYDVVFTTPDTALGYTIPRHVLEENIIKLDYETRIDPHTLAEMLVKAGYMRVDMVEGAGQFAQRGGIIDIYPPFSTFTDDGGQEYKESGALRIEFFGDEIDRMGVFDVDSQRLMIGISSATITPAREILADAASRLRIADAVMSEIRACDDRAAQETLNTELNMLKQNDVEIKFIDKYISLVYPERCCLLDYFDSSTLLLIRGSSKIKERLKAGKFREEQLISGLCAEKTILQKYAEYSKPTASLDDFCSANITLHIDSLAYGLTDRRLSGLFGFRTRCPVSYAEKFDLLCEDIIGYQRAGYKIIVMTENEQAANSLRDLLCDADINAVSESEKGDIGIADLPAKTVYIKWKEYLYAYELIGAKTTILTTNSNAKVGALNTSAKLKKAKKKRRDCMEILSYAELEVGDLVVHENYGIGRYLGIENLKIDGVCRDYISIQYAGTDKLCIPVEKLDMVSKYIGAHSDDGLVKLSKMGGENWKKSKARVKGAVKEMAKELIKLYSERMKKAGFAFDADDYMQKNFEESFDYEETQCQLDAIEDIKHDMMLPVPMDRLLCGDVGYGKTEVAFRAAYKAVLSGKQVAILVPTTILALQHYQTALSRLRSFGVNIDMISRFRTTKQQDQTLHRLARGDIDIIIGTHRLLGKDVIFHDLGLLIIDEEQRFGVAQKEKIKQITGNIDVLTLTATPIPRTLNMAMGGIRDMSILDEAPGDRLPVQSYVLEYDDIIINDAIRRELRRGGQVFYLHNFVESINGVGDRLSKAIPEARITVAHGKMGKDELEDIWAKMLTGEIDILVCTTIIETGVDIPNANTLIIDNANRLGLSQLHQLRGRVGRSSRRAYAYFTFPKDKTVSEIAQKRLEAIREYTEFGAGFRIALRDMEIRGAGNLLGAEQHGHLDSIGYDMYIKLLNDAVIEEKGGHTEEKKECVISVDLDAYIPESYVEYPAQRMALYKRIALINDQYDADDIADELLDRFGEMPQSVDNLLRIALLRANAVRCGLRQITQNGRDVRMYPYEFDFDMWSYMSEVSNDRIKVSMTPNGETFAVLKLKPQENAMVSINKMFEKYLLSVQKNNTNNP